MKTKTKVITLSVLLVLIVALGFLVYNAYQVSSSGFSATQIYSLKNSFGGFTFDTTGTTNVVTSTNGDVYYERRCIDVTQYLASGYVFLNNDADNCPIVGKAIVSATQNIGIQSGWCYKGTLRSCGSGCSTSAKDPCSALLGASWYGSCIGTSTAISGGTSAYASMSCNLGGYDKKGGSEQVQNTCQYTANQLLAGETFNSGTTITKLTTRYPIAGFCLAHPAIVTDSNLKQSVTSTNVYQDLLNGKSVTVPAAQTITLFYIVNNNKNLPTTCDSTQNLALDVNSNTTACKSTLGFTYLCSAGVFDAKTGTCLVQPSTATICAQGRYDISLDKCVYNPPIQYDCGSNSAVYDIDRNVCVEYVKDVLTCGAGETLYQPTQTQCAQKNGVWQTCPQCPSGKVCPASICEARCSVGVSCLSAAPQVKVCDDANATIVNGQCQVQGQTIKVCAENTVYDAKLDKCVGQYDTVQTCSDGTQPTTNSITGQKECIVQVEKFVNCPTNQIYDQSTSRCVDAIQVTTATTTPVLYTEVRNGCTTSFGCDTGLVCNTNLNICQTPVQTSTNWLPVLKWVAALIVVVIITYFVAKSRTKK